MKKLLANTLTAVFLLLMPILNYAQAPPLGTASGFVLFTTVGAVTNTGVSHITGNVGTNSGSTTGFGNVNGVMENNNGATAQCAADLLIAYNFLNSMIPTFFPAPLLGNGSTLFEGVYSITGASTLNADLFLDAEGDPNAVFVFQIQGPLSTSANSKIKLLNGAQACNVFWKIEGLVDMASGTTMRGTVIANNAAINMNAGDTLEGRALSTTGAIGINGVLAYTPIGCGSPVLTGPSAPNLASAACYALFSSNGPVTNSGDTYVTGDIGTNVGLTTGYNPLYVTGDIHDIPDGSTAQCAADLLNVYNYLNVLPYDIELLYPEQFGNNLVLTPHTYLMNAATTFTDTLYLDAGGVAGAVFVIQINGALSTSTYSKVILINGTLAENVYWKVDGAVSINDYSIFKGTIVANNAAVNLTTGVTLDGRALTTTGALSTTAVTVTIPPGCGIVSSPPEIINEPTDQSACVGESVSFTVVATGEGLNYQWRLGNTELNDGGNISGANTDMLTINPVSIIDAASDYNVVVSGTYPPEATSINVSLTVNPLPVPVINGPNAVLQGATDVVYTTEGGMTGYIWNISSGGIITLGANSNTILVTWNDTGSQSVEVNYTNENLCTALAPTVYPVLVSALSQVECPDDFEVCLNEPPFTLTGGIPEGGTYSGSGIMVSSVFDPAGAGQGTHLITYTYDYITYQASCTFNITVNELPLVTCPNDFKVCVVEPAFTLTGSYPAGGIYSIDGIPGNTFNPGLLGEGPHTINYYFTEINGCSGSCSYLIEVIPLPVVELLPDLALSCDDFEMGVPKPYQVTSVVTGNGLLEWTSNGTGTFDDPNIPDPIYTFSGQDILSGSVTFTLTAQSAGLCSEDVSEQFTVIIPSQLLDIPAGWSGISSYIVPTNSAVANVMAPCIDKLIIQVSIGGIFWPEQNINTIINWNAQVGYKVKFSEPCCLPIFGIPVLLPSTINLKAGVNYMPVHSPLPIELTGLFGADTSKIIMIVDIYTLQVYNPGFGMFNTLVNLEPGTGYMAYMSQQANITYPEPLKNLISVNLPVTREPYQVTNHTSWNNVSNTGSVHFISFEKSALTNLETGDFLGAFNSAGICTGMAEFTGGDRIILPVFGDDPFTSDKNGMSDNEFISFRVYHNLSGIASDLSVSWDPASPDYNGLYVNFGFSKILKMTIGATSVNNEQSEKIVIFPNPTSDYLIIQSPSGIDNIKLLNFYGQTIFNESVENSNERLLDVTNYAKGVYFIEVKTSSGWVTNQRILIQ